MNPDMTRHHMTQLLSALMHYMDLDLRHKVMAEVPAAYNDYYGREIVATHAKAGRS